MIDLYLHGREVNTVFQLLGSHENDISYSVSWGLAICGSFLAAFIRELVGYEPDLLNTRISLQEYEEDSGITDIEIKSEGRFHVIIEAKRGWNLPGDAQLSKYVRRLSSNVGSAPIKLLVVLSECSRDYAAAYLAMSQVDGIPVRSVSWQDLAEYAKTARVHSSHAEKRVIDQLLKYLEELMTMQNVQSNWVWVVSLGKGRRQGWDVSWIDIVEGHRRYFYPIGGKAHGPKTPPNYIAFRYDGRLQSIHHIENYEVFRDPHEHFLAIPSQVWSPHYLYHLGPAFRPSRRVKTGKIYGGGHVWCMLDTLFTTDTISGARDLSRRRTHGLPGQMARD